MNSPPEVALKRVDDGLGEGPRADDDVRHLQTTTKARVRHVISLNTLLIPQFSNCCLNEIFMYDRSGVSK